MRALAPLRLGALIFGLSWTVRVALLLFTGSYLQPVNPVETVLVAENLAAGQGFSNPYGCTTGPTAHLAPVYPFLLSLIYRVFPSGSSRELASFLFAATLISLAYALLPWLATRLRLPQRVGVIAGLVGAGVPLFFWVEVLSEWEAPLSALLLVVALGAFASLVEQITIRRAVAAGIAWGVALLTAPILLPVFMALFVVLVWRSRRNIKPMLRPAAALWLPIVLLILPWTLRNYQVFHQFILIRGNAGLQLHMSFNPLARATFDEGVASGAFLDHPHTTMQACGEFARFGEVAMNRLYEQQAWEWIRGNPERSCQLILEHFVAFWRMAVPSPAKTVASELITLFALLGLALCPRRYPFAGLLLGIVLLTYPLVFYINFVEPRYRYPLHPICLILAGVFFIEAARLVRRGPDVRRVS
jgi:4-amino-4-deoxy-L-arabinose transferase-like glycosyltransferase